MEKIPKPILSIIFSMVPSFDQVAKIAMVCRKWKNIVENMYHSVSFQRSDDHRCWSDKNSIYIMTILLEKFASPYPNMKWKLLHLDIKSLNIKKKDLAMLLLAQPRLLKLDLSNTRINLSGLWENVYKAKCEAEENNSSNTIEFSLEELRITNNKKELGHYTLIKLFPNLKWLYAGNTWTNIFDFKKIIKNLPKLEILDISNCSDCYSEGDDYCEKVIKKYAKMSHLKTIFYSYINIEEVNESKKLNFEEVNGVKIINKSICEILEEENHEKLVANLREWLDLGGDVNLHAEIYDGEENEQDRSWNYPHLKFIKKTEEKRTIEIFKMLLLHGLDLAENYLVEKSIYENSKNKLSDSKASLSDEERDSDGQIEEAWTDLLLLSGMTNKIELFRFFVRNSFPLANEKYFRGLPAQAMSELFNLYINHEIPGYFSENLITEALNCYLAANKNLSFAWTINEIINKEANLSINEKFQAANNALLDLSLVYEDNKLIFGNFHINHQDECGRTFLMLASAFGNEEIVDMLYKKGADVNIKDDMGYTALHYAAERGYKKTVEALISYGAMPSAPAESGISAISLAKIGFYKEIVKILIEAEKEKNEVLEAKLVWNKGKRRIFKESENN